MHAPADAQMLVKANEVDYDYTNRRVAAVGNVQIYYNGATIEADQVIYDQVAKRLRAEGNARLTEADGKVAHGEVIDLTDDYRDGFVNSLRVETADDTRIAAARANRSERQFHGVRERRLHRLRGVPRRSEEAAAVAGQGRAHHPQSDRADDVFRGRALEFFGVPIAYMPYLATPDPTVKRKSGVADADLFQLDRSTASASRSPTTSRSRPNYDLTISPRVTTKQGAAAAGGVPPSARRTASTPSARAGRLAARQGLFRRRRPDARLPRFPRQHRVLRQVQPDVQLDLGLGRAPDHRRDLLPGLPDPARCRRATPTRSAPPLTEGTSRTVADRRGERSYFDARTMYFKGFSTLRRAERAAGDPAGRSTTTRTFDQKVLRWRGRASPATSPA